MPKKTKQIMKGLEKKGFKKVSTHHHIFFYYTLQGVKTSIRTKISHGKREYDDILLKQISKQLKIEKGELDQLIDCPLGQKEYEEILKNKKIIE